MFLGSSKPCGTRGRTWVCWGDSSKNLNDAKTIAIYPHQIFLMKLRGLGPAGVWCDGFENCCYHGNHYNQHTFQDHQNDHDQIWKRPVTRGKIYVHLLQKNMLILATGVDLTWNISYNLNMAGVDLRWNMAGADLATLGNVDGQADSALCAGRRGSGQHHHQHHRQLRHQHQQHQHRHHSKCNHFNP